VNIFRGILDFMRFSIIYLRVLCQSVVFGIAAVSLEASPTRDTTLDNRLPRHIPPAIDLSLYRSVQERAGQNPEIAVAMAISGGGHRAANFAVGVMLCCRTGLRAVFCLWWMLTRAVLIR